jgi:hypothetical protein
VRRHRGGTYRDEALADAKQAGIGVSYQDCCEHAHLMAQQETDEREEAEMTKDHKVQVVAVDLMAIVYVPVATDAARRP